MLGVETKRGANRILRDLAIEEQVLALPAGRTVVRLLPPLTVDRVDADRVVGALTEVMS
jgi:acetylornithine/LysW-gamma-L-lysine aminotransferase